MHSNITIIKSIKLYENLTEHNEKIKDDTKKTDKEIVTKVVDKYNISKSALYRWLNNHKNDLDYLKSLKRDVNRCKYQQRRTKNKNIKIANEFVNIFKSNLHKHKEHIKCPDSYSSRKIPESEWFRVYIYFLYNSIHFSRFEMVIKDKNNKIFTVMGKQLNNKVNNWRKSKIIDEIFESEITDYVKRVPNSNFFIISIDTMFVPNMYCKTSELERNPHYKSKYGAKVFNAVDIKGTPIEVNISEKSSGLDHTTLESSIKFFPKEEHKKYIINQETIYLLADAGYHSEKSKDLIRSKGFIPLIAYNKRNTKDEDKINKNKMTKEEKKIYSKRIIVENTNAWEVQGCPRLAKIYDKSKDSFLCTVKMSVIRLLINRRINED